MTSRWNPAMLLTAAVLVANGCAQDSADLYAGEQSEADVLPTWVNAMDRGWDADSSRLLATYDGVEFYAVAAEDSDCLVTLNPDEPGNLSAGCNAGGHVRTTGHRDIQVDFVPAGLPGEIPDGWQRLTPQLQIRTS